MTSRLGHPLKCRGGMGCGGSRRAEQVTLVVLGEKQSMYKDWTCKLHPLFFLVKTFWEKILFSVKYSKSMLCYALIDIDYALERPSSFPKGNLVH